MKKVLDLPISVRIPVCFELTGIPVPVRGSFGFEEDLRTGNVEKIIKDRSMSALQFN